MRLSEKIALGSLMLRPVPGILNDGHGGGCAFGMAKAADSAYVDKAWLTEIHEDVLPCDCGKDKSLVMGGMCTLLPRSWSARDYTNAIVHIFNYHVATKKDWTIDQLCDWVRSVEPDEPEEVVPTTEVIQEALAELVTK